MSRYRKIEVKMWGDAKFCKLSPMPPSGKALWIYLVTGPFTSVIPGLFSAGHAAMAETLGWPLDVFDHLLDEIQGLGMVEVDLQARVVWLPNAIKHNRPESLNVVKAWASALDLI